MDARTSSLLAGAALGLACGCILFYRPDVGQPALIGPAGPPAAFSKPGVEPYPAAARAPFMADGPPGSETLRVGRNPDWQLEITQEELDQTLELSRQHANGQYVMLYERPLSKKAQERTIRDIVEELERNEGSAFARLFEEFGVSPDVTERLKAHGAKIARAALEAEGAIHQVWQARLDYDERVRSHLSPEQYERYRALEAERPARRELEKIDAFYQEETGQSIGAGHRELISRLILETQTGIDSVSFHRPYDDLPGITVGTEAVLRKLEQTTPEFAGRLFELSRRATEAGLPEEYQAALERYFAGKLKEKQEQIQALREKLARGTGAPRAASE